MALRDRKQPAPQSSPRRRGRAPLTSSGNSYVVDRELDSYLAALSPETDVGPVEVTGRFSAEVFQLRLPALRIEQLRRFATERGIAPATLAMDWVIERLDAEDPMTGPVAVIPPPPEDPDPSLPAVDPGRHRR